MYSPQSPSQTTIGTRAVTNQTGAGMARSDIADVYHLPI